MNREVTWKEGVLERFGSCWDRKINAVETRYLLVMADSVVALCIGVIFGFALLIYESVLTVYIENRIDERGITVLQILGTGGGSGVLIWLTDTYLSSFVYGLAGLVLVVVAVAIGSRWGTGWLASE
ncbi:hypothetical protein [Natrinema sp. H-ect4]|uniref:hypothetical protein n=1 Tax=Natrinema sp. H-ect4 TaxID=3242699 RepID=UPI0035A910C2